MSLYEFTTSTAITLAVVVMALPSAPGRAADLKGLQAATPAERAIVKQVATGKDVDLSGLAAPSNQVRLSFLKQLLSGVPATAIPGGKVRISHADFVDASSEEDLIIPFDVELDDSEFRVPFECNGCHFLRSFSISGSNLAGGVKLQFAEVERSLFLTNDRNNDGSLSLISHPFM